MRPDNTLQIPPHDAHLLSSRPTHLQEEEDDHGAREARVHDALGEVVGAGAAGRGHRRVPEEDGEHDEYLDREHREVEVAPRLEDVNAPPADQTG